mmetsp:Transcript_15317/g.19975  ORF Transcript_15317/g.19975 Transcript_15317/m.19975 type:complete len:178 (+) Transcript_15317:183-716(+)|eukprot:CAMPEP_0198148352 /NCGR_PEP_ID=MMETSP1443-20131203/40959_1 /TAXON_ID=186043 /ORGANISM="Entomoneis sp., Strain CCMP2396" /LENGTH=177 /DNA_ID=CAMNT_0043813015 /DNA_START=137 /DNA_END=670 /DNA_ORIENTATION=+
MRSTIDTSPQEEAEPLIDENSCDLTFSIADHDDTSANVDDREEVHYDLQDPGDVTRPTPRGGPVEQWESDLESDRRQMSGAAAAGAIAGLVVGGPILALFVAGGAAAVATTRGKAGQVTRSTGEAMAQAGDRLKLLDEKHHFSENVSKRLSKSAKWVSEKIKPQHERERDAAFDLTN